MKTRMTAIAFASGTFFAAVLGTASAQDALSSCNPVTGLAPSGQQCVTLTPVDPTRYQTQIDGEGSSNYRPVDVAELAETYECGRSNGARRYGAGDGSILIEDCGQALEIDPATFREFVGYSGNSAPAPVQTVAYSPAPVQVVAPAPAPVVLTPAPAAPVMASAGLGNAGLIAAGLGAAAVIGVIAFAVGDDDDDDATPTTN